jgi:hypothetical protein
MIPTLCGAASLHDFQHGILTAIQEYLRSHGVRLRETAHPAAGLVKADSNDSKPDAFRDSEQRLLAGSGY